MAVYARKIEIADRRFGGRAITLTTPKDVSVIPVPDKVVVCDGCNKNLYPDAGYLVYLDKRELNADHPYDIFCESCLKDYFPKAVTVES